MALTRSGLSCCPKPWQNFVMHYNPTSETPYAIDDALLQYNARIIIEHTYEMHVKFKSIEDKTRFLLTWS